MVAPCGGMTSEALALTDRRSIDRPSLDDDRPFRGDLFRRLVARTLDGDMAGPIVVMIVVCDHEQPAVGGSLRFGGIGELDPAAGGAFPGEPFVLGVR